MQFHETSKKGYLGVINEDHSHAHEKSHQMICAWCKKIMGSSRVESSHGMCRSCYISLMGIPDLSLTKLDALPFGVIIVDMDGRIKSYNQAVEQFSGRRKENTLGKNFFTEVAPCTDVTEFHGRFLQLIAEEMLTFRFNFTFKFKQGDMAVRITLFLVDDGQAAIIVRKARSNIPE